MPKPALFEFAKEMRNGNEKCHAVAQKMSIELDEEMQIVFNQLKVRTDVPGNVLEEIAQTDKVIDVQVILPSRNIPNLKKREVHAKTNGKCSYKNCTRAIENCHHTIPFAFNRNHDSLVGLCKIHHEFCHNGVVKNELQEPGNWKINLKPEKSLFDSLYLKYKAGFR